MKKVKNHYLHQKNFKIKLCLQNKLLNFEKFIKDLELENIAFGKIVWTNHNFNQAIFGFDRRAPDLFKQDMYNKDGTTKYKDMKE